MKRVYYLLTIFSVALLSVEGFSQTKESIMAETEIKSVFDQKFYWGIGYHQYWGTIKGSNLPKEYFAKPCFGASLRAEFYPFSFVGIGAGFGVQQRGAGVKNHDNYGGSFTHPWEPNYDPDSTYRERLRMNTIEVPVSLLLRTPKDVIKGIRLSGAIGIVWVYNDYVKDFWHKPEDGFHTIIDVGDDYITNDLAYQLSFGADINAAESCVLQVHLVYTKGTENVYKTGPGNGQTETFGFRVSWLF
jgi:hypothetical protein